MPDEPTGFPYNRLRDKDGAVPTSIRQGKFIIGICHILLDISAEVDDDFIERYEVPMGSGILAKELHAPMYGEMQQLPLVEYTPGGATLNSIRIAQWVLGGSAAKGSTAMLGAIGEDLTGQDLEKGCNREGVATYFMTTSTARTGTCAICINSKERGMVASLDAANEYKLEHLKANDMLLESAGIVYTAGFFLGCCGGEIAIYAAERTKETGALFCMNLSACYVPKAYPNELTKLIALSDYVFGNNEEATAYGESVGLTDTSAASVAKHIAGLTIEKTSRTVVITQGTKCTILARSDGLYFEVPIVHVPHEQIVDLNAAGDSFVGGFLAALSVGKTPEKCVQTGLLAASYIIQRSGCTFEGNFWQHSEVGKEDLEEDFGRCQCCNSANNHPCNGCIIL